MVALNRWKLGMLLALVACRRAQPSDSHSQEWLHAYPPGRWRLDTSHLADTVLWVSQILIRYDEVEKLEPCFSLAYWRLSLPPAAPSREVALALANDLASQLERDPERFTELERTHSEDTCSRDNGGSLGGVAASQLEPFPEVLDALAATSVGRVSRVVETRSGFHLFLRRAPPPEQVVSGARITIAYDEAGWSKLVARGTPRSRSRTEALALANEVYARASEPTSDFTSLVDQYSEHIDALRGGDLGSWSTREPSDFPREVEVLSRLEVGGVAAPLDSAAGYEILQRTPNRPRTTYAMDQVCLAFNPELPSGQPGSEAKVFAIARSIARELHSSPGRFDALRQEYGCTQRDEWADGHGSTPLSNVLDRLAIGEISAEPVLLRNCYVIPRRREPSLPQRPSVSFELPDPEHPNIAVRLALLDVDTAITILGPLVREAVARLQLDQDTAQRLTRLHQSGPLFESTTPVAARVAAYPEFQRHVAELLGPERYAQYGTWLNAHFEALLLKVPGHG